MACRWGVVGPLRSGRVEPTAVPPARAALHARVRVEENFASLRRRRADVRLGDDGVRRCFTTRIGRRSAARHRTDVCISPDRMAGMCELRPGARRTTELPGRAHGGCAPHTYGGVAARRPCLSALLAPGLPPSAELSHRRGRRTSPAVLARRKTTKLTAASLPTQDRVRRHPGLLTGSGHIAHLCNALAMCGSRYG